MIVAGVPLGVLCQKIGSANLKLLLNFDAADNSSVFVDSSSYNNAITNVGAPTIVGNKGVFDGNSYIYTDTLPNLSDFDFEITGKFLMTAYPTGFQEPAIFGYEHNTPTTPLALRIIPYAYTGNLNKLNLEVYDGLNVPHSLFHQTVPSLNVEHTFKVERTDGVVRLWLDEVEADTNYAIGTETIISNVSRFCVGRANSGLLLFNGKVDDLSVSIFD